MRFRLDPPRVEARSSDTQFGNTFDAWGHYFTSENNDHIRHEVVAARYLERNPQLPSPRRLTRSPITAGPPRVFPITANPEYDC